MRLLPLLALLLGCGRDPIAPAPAETTEPATTEVCNGEDDDGDGLVDEDPADGTEYFLDTDGDGYGVSPIRACRPVTGLALEGDDCDDRDATRYPLAPEVCGDGVVNDCGGAIPDAPCRHTGRRTVDEVAILVVHTENYHGDGFASAAGVGDLDQDGYDDVVLGSPFGSDVVYGMVLAYFGGPAPRTAHEDAADLTWLGPGESRAGEVVSPAGDLNADGIPDVLVDDFSNREDVWLVMSPHQDLDLGEVTTRLPTTPPSLSAEDVVGNKSAHNAVGVGDVDGDGYDDVVHADGYASAGGAVYLQLGPIEAGVTRKDAYADWFGDEVGANINEGSMVGHTVDYVGDLTGDGLSEVGMSAINVLPSWAGVVLIASDPAKGSYHWTEADFRISGTPDEQKGVGFDFEGGEDVDADGYTDLVIGGSTVYSYEEGVPPPLPEAAWLIPGPLTGDVSLVDARATIEVFDGVEGSGGVGAVLPGDMDGDGLSEVAVGLPRAYGGTVSLFYGPVEGRHLWTEADALFTGTAYTEGNGYPGGIDGAGDFDGDGLRDLVVVSWDGGQEGSPRSAGWVIPGAGLW